MIFLNAFSFFLILLNIFTETNGIINKNTIITDTVFCNINNIDSLINFEDTLSIELTFINSGIEKEINSSFIFLKENDESEFFSNPPPFPRSARWPLKNQIVKLKTNEKFDFSFKIIFTNNTYKYSFNASFVSLCKLEYYVPKLHGGNKFFIKFNNKLQIKVSNLKVRFKIIE